MTNLSVADKPLSMNESQFEIIHSIGAGATAEVFKALNKKTDSYVALKSFSSFISQDKDSLKRLRDEIQILKTFNHPNVVKLLGEHQIDSQLCLELELVEGQHLGDWIKSSRNPLLEVNVWILVQVARGLGAVHEKGFIHRDLKPENILISNQADVKLSDFGLAKELNRLTMTRLGLLVGSLGYMAPEVIEGEKANMKSDIFSFGAVAYELLSGKPPISGETPQALLKNAMEPIVPLNQVSPHIPPRVGQIIDQCLTIDKSKRPESIWSIESELMGYLNQTGILPLCRELVKNKPDQDIFKKALSQKKNFMLAEVEKISKETRPDKKYLLSVANELQRLFPEEPKGLELLGLLKKKNIENPKRLSLLGLCFLFSSVFATVFYLSNSKERNRPLETSNQANIKDVRKVTTTPVKMVEKPQITKVKQAHIKPKESKVEKPKLKVVSKSKAENKPKKATPKPIILKGLLKFIVDEDVDVFVDGQKVLKDDLLSFSVKAGEHKVKMIKKGFMPLENTVMVRANQTTTINTRRARQ